MNNLIRITVLALALCSQASYAAAPSFTYQQVQADVRVKNALTQLDDCFFNLLREGFFDTSYQGTLVPDFSNIGNRSFEARQAALLLDWLGQRRSDPRALTLLHKLAAFLFIDFVRYLATLQLAHEHGAGKLMRVTQDLYCFADHLQLCMPEDAEKARSGVQLFMLRVILLRHAINGSKQSYGDKCQSFAIALDELRQAFFVDVLSYFGGAQTAELKKLTNQFAQLLCELGIPLPVTQSHTFRNVCIGLCVTGGLAGVGYLVLHKYFPEYLNKIQDTIENLSGRPMELDQAQHEVFATVRDKEGRVMFDLVVNKHAAETIGQAITKGALDKVAELPMDIIKEMAKDMGSDLGAGLAKALTQDRDAGGKTVVDHLGKDLGKSMGEALVRDFDPSNGMTIAKELGQQIVAGTTVGAASATVSSLANGASSAASGIASGVSGVYNWFTRRGQQNQNSDNAGVPDSDGFHDAVGE